MNRRTVPIEKVCPVCESTFLACPPGRSSRTYPRSSQVFCSTECAGKARYRSGSQANTLSDLDAAYMAGFIDADGTICLYRRGDKRSLRLLAANRDKGVLEWMAEVTGVGSVVSSPRQDYKKHCPSWFWQCNSEAAESVIRQLIPYLHTKRRQGEMAVQFQERLRDPSLNADRSWQDEWFQEMRALNQRGPGYLEN